MKINSGDFPVERSVIFATEDECIYDNPMPRLEETWNNLAKYYVEKAEIVNSLVRKENEFFLPLAHSKVENETAMTVYQLVSQNIIKTYITAEYKEERANIKPFIISELRGILRKRLKELKENIADEEMVYKEIKKIHQDVRLVDNQIRIYSDGTNYIDFKKMRSMVDYKSKGLSCSLKYRDIHLCCYVKRSHLDFYDEIQEYFYEQTLAQRFCRNELLVEIGHVCYDGKNTVCAAIIAELRQGKQLCELHESIIVGLSRYFLDRLLRAHQNIRFIETEDEKAIDGLSKMFFVTADNSTFKVIRNTYHFDIFFNGEPICFRTKE